MSDSLKITPGQASDVEAASEAIYSEAADQVVQIATLGRDLLAILTLFFIIVTYHIQNPLLQFGTQFGDAFRNPTLQPVLAVALVVSIAGLAGGWRRLRPNRLQMIVIGALAVYALHSVLAVIFNFNVLGMVFSIPQNIFLDKLGADAPLDALQNALNVSTVMEYLALVGVVIVWLPWQRLPVYRKAVQRNAPVLLVAVAALVVWEIVINIFNIQQFLLPRPSVIFTQFSEIYPRLVTVGWNTFQNAFWGFFVGCGLGILTGLVSARFTNFSRALLPLAIAANSVPMIAFAPLMNNWFGALNALSKISIVAVLTYFPAMISTVRGLSAAEVTQVELMKSYAASQWEIFRKLRFPAALPFIFSALKVATTLSMIGAIVSEYFGGSTQGLGYRIKEDAALFKYPESWSAIIMASLLGIGFYLVISAVERWLMPWHVSFRED